jgi:hypothetical protein
MPSASEAEVPRPLDVGTDTRVTLTDLGQLLVWVKCMEHRSMSFLSRLGTLLEARRDARTHEGAPLAQGGLASSGRERAHGARRPAGNHHVGVEHRHGTSFRVDAHDDPSPPTRSSEFPPCATGHDGCGSRTNPGVRD